MRGVWRRRILENRRFAQTLSGLVIAQRSIGARRRSSPRSSSCLIYQGYSLSIVGVASPWIAKSFSLNQAKLAELFAWMSLSAFGALILARLADRVGRRRIILSSLVLAPLCAVGAALARHPASFAVSEILISALLGGSVSSAIVLLAEELPVEQRARGQAFAAGASAIGGVLGYMVIPFLLQWEYSWRWLLVPCIAGVGLVFPLARMLPVDSRWARPASRSRFRQPLLRHLPSALSASCHYAFGVRRARHDCRQRRQWLALFRRGFNYRTVAAKGEFHDRRGMVLGMLGFPAGAWASDRFGRVPTVMYVGGAAWLGAVAFYWGPPNGVTWPLCLAGGCLLLVQDRLGRDDRRCELGCNRIISRGAAHHDDRVAGNHRRRILDAGAGDHRGT